MGMYLDYVQGKNLTNRMPLYIRPDNKISLDDAMHHLRDHFEGTWLDFTQDVGAEAYHAPYRWRPLTWAYKGDEYLNERATATPQTGFTFVAQTRNWLPDQVGGILWFGVDDSAMAVRVPIYCGTDRAPARWALGYGDLMTFKWDSAFWIFNLVSNYVYNRYSLIYPEVVDKINTLQQQYYKQITDIDKRASEQFQKGNSEQGTKIISDFSVETADQLIDEWTEFFTYLFVKYMDGYSKRANPKGGNPIIDNPGYDEKWLSQIVAQDGDHYRVPSSKQTFTKSKLLSKII
jgi:dipeptidase